MRYLHTLDDEHCQRSLNWFGKAFEEEITLYYANPSRTKVRESGWLFPLVNSNYSYGY